MCIFNFQQESCFSSLTRKHLFFAFSTRNHLFFPFPTRKAAIHSISNKKSSYPFHFHLKREELSMFRFQQGCRNSIMKEAIHSISNRKTAVHSISNRKTAVHSISIPIWTLCPGGGLDPAGYAGCHHWHHPQHGRQVPLLLQLGARGHQAVRHHRHQVTS